MSPRIGMRICAALFSLALVGAAGAASAHVTVSSPDAASGGWGKLIFRVPTESETASTTSITVTLPQKSPLASVSSQPKPGWSVKLTKVKHDKPVKVGDFELTETISAVTWTATGDGIKPGEFDEFALSVGPLPDAKDVTFTVAQTYSDKTVANWDQIAEGDKEPEHPAPSLELAAATDDGHGSATADSPKSASAAGANNGDGATWGIAIAALALAAVALALGLQNAGLRKNGRNA